MTQLPAAMSPEELDRLPRAVADFPLIRARGQIYVDKTDLIHQLAATRDKYFLSRPRRFGKSLLLSTFEALFHDGLRDFGGLKIEELWHERRTWPVLRLDFSLASVFASREEFMDRFCRMVGASMHRAGLEPPPEQSSRSELDRFDSLLAAAAADSLVLLIDEYDAPLNSCLERPELFTAVRDVLRDFYLSLKANARALRFMFFTGIVRYRHTGIFSGFNIYEDLTLNPRYATLLGYTQAEICRYFEPYLTHAAAVLGLSVDGCLDGLREHYDGFCFDELASATVYAPWSVLNFFKNPELGYINYWYDSAGRPELLIGYLRERLRRGDRLPGEGAELSLADLNSARETGGLSAEALLTQAGYLTIKAVDQHSGMARVNFPNRELTESMRTLYADVLFGAQDRHLISDLRRTFLEDSPQEIIAWLNDALFACADYLHYAFTGENAVRTTLQMCLAAAGLSPVIERHSARGRSDLEVTAGTRHFVMEFKYLKASGGGDEQREEERGQALLEQAAAQLQERRYGLPPPAGTQAVRMALVFSERQRSFTHTRVLTEA